MSIFASVALTLAWVWVGFILLHYYRKSNPLPWWVRLVTLPVRVLAILIYFVILGDMKVRQWLVIRRKKKNDSV